MPFYKYNLTWSDDTDLLTVEMHMIRCGGRWKDTNGKLFGNGLPYHFEEMRKILWPHLDDHRWHRLCRDEILKNKITVLMGPGSSGKTHEASWIYLCEYFCFPEDTCVLVSSTDIRGLKMRVWGEITMLWKMARDQYDYLPGHLLDSKIAITTDSLEDGEFGERSVRDMRKGIIGIPCVNSSGTWVGLGKFLGIKQKRLRLIADEAAMMSGSFLSAFANLNKNEDFRAVILGNPNDPLDPLGKAAEPRDGWTDYLEPEKTIAWDTRFMNGRCVNLIGTDSPNFDFPADKPARYKYLISREKIADTLSFFAKDSIEYYSQCVGTMKVGTMARRVISRELCRQFKALENAVWKGTERTKISALDAAWGGDRAVTGHAEFGSDPEGKILISIFPPVIVPISVRSSKSPEDQIAEFVRGYCEEHAIPPENFFHDSTGRGTLGTALARAWSAMCNPVEFGGRPTERPVSLDLFIWDDKLKQRRLKTCREHYSKFVTELWYSVRYTIEAGQMRNLPEDVMEEGCMRQWEWVQGDKLIEVESKREMKERVGRSPDLFDWLAIIVEGARRRGFGITKLAQVSETEDNDRWLEESAYEYEQIIKKALLTHA
jgi:hypothetical protein